MTKSRMKKVNSLYKGERPGSELAYLVVKEFMVVAGTYGKFWSERELREKVDDVLMAYFKKTKRSPK